MSFFFFSPSKNRRRAKKGFIFQLISIFQQQLGLLYLCSFIWCCFCSSCLFFAFPYSTRIALQLTGMAGLHILLCLWTWLKQAFLGFSSCLSSPHFRLFCDFSSQSTSTLVRPCLHVLLSLTAYKASDLWSFGGWIPGFLLHPYLCCCFDSRLSVSVTLHLLSAPSSSPSFHDSIGVKLPHLPKMRILCIPEHEDFLSDYLLELKIAI